MPPRPIVTILDAGRAVGDFLGYVNQPLSQWREQHAGDLVDIAEWMDARIGEIAAQHTDLSEHPLVLARDRLSEFLIDLSLDSVPTLLRAEGSETLSETKLESATFHNKQSNTFGRQQLGLPAEREVYARLREGDESLDFIAAQMQEVVPMLDQQHHGRGNAIAMNMINRARTYRQIVLPSENIGYFERRSGGVAAVRRSQMESKYGPVARMGDFLKHLVGADDYQLLPWRMEHGDLLREISVAFRDAYNVHYGADGEQNDFVRREENPYSDAQSQLRRFIADLLWAPPQSSRRFSPTTAYLLHLHSPLKDFENPSPEQPASEVRRKNLYRSAPGEVFVRLLKGDETLHHVAGSFRALMDAHPDQDSHANRLLCDQLDGAADQLQRMLQETDLRARLTDQAGSGRGV